MTDKPLPDSHALLLLCGRFGSTERKAGAPAPLSVSEWNGYAERLLARGHRPGQLLGLTAERITGLLGIDAPEAGRLADLLGRGGQLAIELERLGNLGIWPLTRADAHYPSRWKRRLGKRSPMVLFGAGDVHLLNAGGVAIVGSRDTTEHQSDSAARIGRLCARAHLTVISGAARGIDRIAMLSAAENVGAAVGVVANGLEAAIRDRELRGHLMAGRATLVTPYSTRAPFSVGNAMGRNKLVYCLADYAIVVTSSLGSGGTWTGAIENLEHGWVPLMVCNGTDASAGNAALIERGGIPLPSEIVEDFDLAGWLHERGEAGLSLTPVPDSAPRPPHRRGKPKRSDEVARQMALFGD